MVERGAVERATRREMIFLRRGVVGSLLRKKSEQNGWRNATEREYQFLPLRDSFLCRFLQLSEIGNTHQLTISSTNAPKPLPPSPPPPVSFPPPHHPPHPPPVSCFTTAPTTPPVPTSTSGELVAGTTSPRLPRLATENLLLQLAPTLAGSLTPVRCCSSA